MINRKININVSDLFYTVFYHFIFGYTRSPIHIIFSTNNRSFLPVCFSSSLESTPGSSPSTTH